MTFMFPQDYRCNMLGSRFGSLAFLIWRAFGSLLLIAIYILQFTLLKQGHRIGPFFTFSWWTQTITLITYIILIIAFSTIAQQRKENGDCGEDYYTIKVALITYEVSWSGALFNFILFLIYDLPVISDTTSGLGAELVSYSIIISVVPMVLLAVDMSFARVSFVKIHFFIGLIYMTAYEITCIAGGYDIGSGFIDILVNHANTTKTKTVIGIISGIVGHDLMYLLTFLGGYSMHNVFKTKIEVRTNNKESLIKRSSVSSDSASNASKEDNIN